MEGKKRQLPPIGKSVSVSFRVRVVRACVCACEAVRVREAGVPSTLGSKTKRCATPAVIVDRAFLNDSTMGFNGFCIKPGDSFLGFKADF